MEPPRKRRWLLSTFALTLAVAPSLFGADWPQWRGPGRDGVATVGVLPEELPTELRRIWRVEVGTGHASPVVAGERVFVFSRQGETEILRALGLGDGSEIWRHAEETPYRRNPAAFRHGKGPKSTPVVSDGVVCSLGITGRLTCHDGETGRVLWQKDFAGRFDRAWPDFGTATSPAVFDGMLVTHVGGLDSGALIAFALQSGEEIWSWEGDPPAYASPIRVSLDGVDQIVTQSRRYILSVATGSGELLWKTPFTTAYEQNIVTPLRHGGRLIFSGLDNGIFAAEPHRDGRGNWIVQQVWKDDGLPMYMSSPVVVGDLLFGLSDRRKGQLFCLDASTGEVRWRSAGREGDNGSLVVSGDRLLFLDTDGDLSIAEASAEAWEPEATYSVAATPTWAHPALVGDRILVKDEATLALWSFD